MGIVRRKKGEAGLPGRAKDRKTALAEKKRLHFAEHQVGHVKANRATFEAGVPAEHEVYFSDLAKFAIGKALFFQ